MKSERQKKIEVRSIKVYNWPFDISLFFFSFLMIGFYLFYTHHGVINKDEIKEYAKVTLSENVIFKDLGGTKPNNHNYAFAIHKSFVLLTNTISMENGKYLKMILHPAIP